jgi:regulator of protease activity HflC (stomatin/prohibitin superfamily)
VIAILSFGFFLFLFALGGFFIVEPRQARIILRFGKYAHTVTTPGIHYAFPIGLRKIAVSLRDVAASLPVVTVVEAAGNPIHVSCVIVYRVADARRAVIDIQGYHQFVLNQASAALKTVCARYPYEARIPGHPCLKAESDEILAALQAELQRHVESAGLQIALVRLNDLTYSPEIAQSMLLRQQAMAMVEARRTLVEGAVGTVQEALHQMEQAGFQLAPAARERLISNLTLLLCAGERDQHSTVVTRSR